MKKHLWFRRLLNSIYLFNGRLLRVRNTMRRFGSSREYFIAKLQIPNGRKELVLFTKNELEVARKRALANLEDLYAVLWLRKL